MIRYSQIATIAGLVLLGISQHHYVALLAFLLFLLGGITALVHAYQENRIYYKYHIEKHALIAEHISDFHEYIIYTPARELCIVHKGEPMRLDKDTADRIDRLENKEEKVMEIIYAIKNICQANK